MRFQLGGHFEKPIGKLAEALGTRGSWRASPDAELSGARLLWNVSSGPELAVIQAQRPAPACHSEQERSMNAHERPIITEANKTAVRAASTGNNVRYVLIGSVALALLAWILVAYFVRP
jgi:hypothetical protein